VAGPRCTSKARGLLVRAGVALLLSSTSRRLAGTVLVGSLLVGCNGGAPLLHPATVLSPGKVSVGAGMSGQIGLLKQGGAAISKGDKGAPLLNTIATSPGVAPWAAARVGIDYDFEAGLTYTGRSARVDLRHAFKIAPLTMSIGLGATAILPKPQANDTYSFYGGGADLPLLFGWTSDADLYSIWFGPRVGFEMLGGRALGSEFIEGGSTTQFSKLSGQHIYFGGLAGMRVGFRSFHAAIEVDSSYHLAHGTFGEVDAKANNVSITPSGALILTL